MATSGNKAFPMSVPGVESHTVPVRKRIDPWAVAARIVNAFHWVAIVVIIGYFVNLAFTTRL